MLPFTSEQFLGVFEEYNEAVWPMQPVLFVVGLVAVALTFWKKRVSDSTVSTILAGLWLWMGIVYHILFFSAINPVAIAFGILFIVQGFLFLYAGPVRKRLSFGGGKSWTTVLGTCVLLYGLVVYPLLGSAFGQTYTRQPTFGVPCPTTIFTFGLLFWADKCVPTYILIVPLLWAVIGLSAAFLLGMWQDLGLFVVGSLSIPVLLLRNDEGRTDEADRKKRRPIPPKHR